MIAGIDHVNIVVHDLDAMTAFYRDALGMSVTKDVNITGDWIDRVVGLEGVAARVIYLSAPAGPRIELIRFENPRAVRPDALGQPNIPGLRHIAFAANDIDALVKKLTGNGVRFESAVQDVPDSQVKYAGGKRKRLVYFHDPEGNLLEFCEYH